MNWWQYGLINQYGTPDRFGGFPKPDMNILVPAGVAITSLFSGTITAIDGNGGPTPSWGHVITIRMDNPYNSVATHTAYLHLASIPSNLKVGQHVNAGDTIGFSGGSNPGPGLQPAAVGFAFYNGDNYGFGPTWAQFLGSSSLNPTNLFNDLQSGKFVPGSGGGTTTLSSSSGSSGPSIIQQVLTQLGLPSQQAVDTFYQQFMIIFFGGMLVLIGVMVVFFSSDAGKDVTKTAGKAAVLAA